jgi:hypothetical protein
MSHREVEHERINYFYEEQQVPFFSAKAHTREKVLEIETEQKRVVLHRCMKKYGHDDRQRQR